MDVDEGASPRKGKGKARAAELEEREGAARCGGCAGKKSCCWVDPARIKRWKEAKRCPGGCYSLKTILGSAGCHFG